MSASLSATLHTHQCWLSLKSNTLYEFVIFSQKIAVESAWFCYGRLSSPHSSTGLLHASAPPALPWLPWSPTAASCLSQCIYGSLWVFFFFSVIFWRFLLLLSSLSLSICVLCLLSISVWQTGGCVAQVLLAPGSCGRLFLHIIILLLFHTLCTRTVDFRVGLEITLELQK